MESSSESFLWSDASNDSSDSRQFVRVQTMRAPYSVDSSTGVICNEEACDNILTYNHENNENETQKREKKSKKRKHSETIQESSDFSNPGRKKIKLELDIDIDAGKKKKSNKTNNMCNNEPQESIEDYLNLRVKQEQLSITGALEVDKPKKKKKQRNSVPDFDKNAELSGLEIGKNEAENYLHLHVKEEQASLVKTKKKKQKRSNSYTDNGGESKSVLGEGMESYLDVRVKQEQASLVEPGVGKSKKNKKRRSSVISHEMETTNGTKSLMKCEDTTDMAYPPSGADETEYSVIEDKFSAEETVIEKPRKKKHKREAVSKNKSDLDNDNIYNDKRVMITEEHSENMNENDLSLQASDFTCNNIASSTVINNSAVDITFKQQKNKTEDFVRGSKKVSTKKISERIRFEDDSSMQESVCNKLSAKINRFLKANPQLELYNPESLKQSHITEDDEIWALKWPHEIDVEKLRNTTLSLEGKYKIKMEGNIYEGVPSDAVNRITLLVRQDGQALVTNLIVNECIDYHKRIPKPHIPDSNIMVNNQTNFIPLPETKCRHPLFGPHYKKSIKITNAVAEHLEAAKQRSSETVCETNKKKKRKKDKLKELDIKMEEEIKTESLKKKKKRKHSVDEEPPHKPKRIKLESNSTAVWESEQAIEENLFNF